jgi:hypothetical protein
MAGEDLALGFKIPPKTWTSKAGGGVGGEGTDAVSMAAAARPGGSQRTPRPVAGCSTFQREWQAHDEAA